MKTFITYFFFIVIFQIASPLNSEVAVTYELSEGRFGDRFVCYLHAKWISYRYGFPLLYKPFLYSDEFALHEIEELWTEQKERSFNQVLWHVKGGEFSQPARGSRLYVIPFFTDLKEDQQYRQDWACFDVEWEDKGFRNLLRSLFRPRKEYPALVFPKDKDYLTVALHVRRGGGFDPDVAYLLWPLRFVPDSYYIECLKKLCSLFPNRPIYAYIFTDDADPKKIVDSYQSELNDLPITFDCRKEGNRHDAHVIEDFFAMMSFDCLIRSASNYSFLPSLIANYQVVMTPKHFIWRVTDDLRVEKYIDQIEVKEK